MKLPAGYSARSCTWNDLDAVADLVRAADLADVGWADPIREHIEDAWRMPAYDLDRDSVLLEGDGVVAAQASVEGVQPEHSLDVYGRVHPHHRGRGLGDAILTWAEDAALRRSPALAVLRGSTPSTDDAGRRLFEAHGFAAVRTFWHMRRVLDEAPVEAPEDLEGVAIVAYDHDRHVRGTYDALEEAFLDHWASEPYPYEAHAQEAARTDPSLIAVAEADGEVVGAALARLVEGEGWVDVIGMRRAWRGRGAAKAMLLTVFATLRAAGASSVTLNVDSENHTGATGLYESVGMQVHRGWSVFEKRFREEAPG